MNGTFIYVPYVRTPTKKKKRNKRKAGGKTGLLGKYTYVHGRNE